MGKKITVTPEELEKTSASLKQISTNFTEIYKQLLQHSSTMGEAWTGEDNVAFVNQMNGFCEELKLMADKITTAADALSKQKANYATRQESNIAAAQKLAN
jgi:WXG100 family type VII secretion target